MKLSITMKDFERLVKEHTKDKMVSGITFTSFDSEGFLTQVSIEHNKHTVDLHSRLTDGISSGIGEDEDVLSYL